MTTGNSGRGRGGSSGSSGPATSPNKSDGKSHGVAINVIVPVVFMIVVVALGSLLFWYILRRLRRSRGSGRGIWAILLGKEQKPQLVDVILSRERVRDGKWSNIQVSASLFVIAKEAMAPIIIH